METTLCNKVRNIITNWKDIKLPFNQSFNKNFFKEYEKITAEKKELLVHLIRLGNTFRFCQCVKRNTRLVYLQHCLSCL